jgi:hypothetical protein
VIALLAAERGGALLVFLLFLVAYNARTRKVRWWKSEYGRMITALVASIIAMILNGLAGTIWPHYPYRSQVTALVLAGLLFAGAWLVHLMVEALPAVDPPDDSDGARDG